MPIGKNDLSNPQQDDSHWERYAAQWDRSEQENQGISLLSLLVIAICLCAAFLTHFMGG